jgi:hypothetical protein
LYRTRLQDLGCIFPANVDPRITCSNWRAAWKNCSSGGEQLGADCSTDKAVLLLGEAARGTEYGGLDWDGGGGVGVFWVAQHLEVEVQKLGDPPKCGESDRPRGQNFHQWDTTVATEAPEALALHLKLSGCQTLSLLRFPYSIETQEYTGAGGTGPPMNAEAVRCLINNDSSFSQRGLPEWIENSKVLRRIYLVWASLACVERSFKC